MFVVILAGGFNRLSEYTDKIPKPMVEIGSKLIWHIMQYYANYGYNNFVVALGYKQEVIKDYLNFKERNSDFSVNLAWRDQAPICTNQRLKT